jgi:hypothetical protein
MYEVYYVNVLGSYVQKQAVLYGLCVYTSNNLMLCESHMSLYTSNLSEQRFFVSVEFCHAQYQRLHFSLVGSQSFLLLGGSHSVASFRDLCKYFLHDCRYFKAVVIKGGVQ